MKRTGLRVALFGAILVMAGPAAARDKFDGDWALYIFGDAGVCEFGYRVPIRIDGRLVHYNGRTIKPSMVAISDSGSVAIRLDNGSTRVTGSGALSSWPGSGKWAAPSYHCTSRWHAYKQ